MIKELSEQICDELMACAKTFDDDAMVQIAEKIDKANNIFCVGLGRSRLSIMGFAMRLMHMGYSVHLVGDVTTPAIQKGDVLIVGSGSGGDQEPSGHDAEVCGFGCRNLPVHP